MAKFIKLGGTAAPQSIYFPVYGYEVRVVVTTDILRATQLDFPGTDERFDDITESTRAMHVPFKDRGIAYIYIPFDVGLGTIAHESYHAISRMMEYFEIKHEEENMAYHMGFLVLEVYERQRLGREAMRRYYANHPRRKDKGKKAAGGRRRLNRGTGKQGTLPTGSVSIKSRTSPAFDDGTVPLNILRTDAPRGRN